MKRTILLVILAALLGMKGGYELGRYINRPIDIFPQTAEPGRNSWMPPSCPMELTLKDGTRWSPPAWSDPECRMFLQWSGE